MSIGQIIVLAAIVGALVLFAVVLGSEDYRAQQLARRIRDRKAALKQSDKSAAAVSETAEARWPQPSDDRLQHWLHAFCGAESVRAEEDWRR
jgi:hypothetical protein